MGGALLRLLEDDHALMRGDQGLDLLALVADHDHQPFGAERVDRRQQMGEHGLPGDRVQHLVQVGLHPRALARGEDDGGDGPGHGSGDAMESLPFP